MREPECHQRQPSQKLDGRRNGGPISQMRAGGRPAGDPRPGWRSLAAPNAASLPSPGGGGGLCHVSWEPGLG